MRHRFMVSLVVAAGLLFAGTRGWPATVSETPDPIEQQIATKDPTQIQQAVANILSQLQSPTTHDRRVAVRGLHNRGHWLKALMDAQQYDTVVNLALAGTISLPSDPALVEALQTYRVKALLKLGRTQDALAAAKGTFNVCRMQSTANTLLLVAQCLKAAYPGNGTIIDRLRQEQIAGAAVSQTSTKSAQQSVLAAIVIDGSPYATAIQQYGAGTDYESLASVGNLLLLADRAQDAQPVFERAYAVASDKELAAATENLARCMRAEDGAIGRANAWVLSIRPKPASAQAQ